MTERLPRIDFKQSRPPDFWVDEAIWGHRLYDEQIPSLIFMEFLNVLYYNEGKAFIEENFNSLIYSPKKLLHLRNIVFNNPKLQFIKEQAIDDKRKWYNWEQEMNKDGKGVDSGFEYVKNRFNNFDDFYEFVEMLRGTSIEGQSNKQFTSKFIFPYGPNCFFEDLDVNKNFGSGRRFFARSGELAYLMFCRSNYGMELHEKLKPILVNPNNKWNKLVGCLLSVQEKESRSVLKNAYLPYKYLPDYDSLAKDWISLLDQDMPDFDVIPHLVTTLGLHMLLYYLRQSMKIIEPDSNVKIVCEIISPKRNVVRQLADKSFKENDFLSREAVRNYINNVDRNKQWIKLKESNASDDQIQSFLQEYFMIDENNSIFNKSKKPDEYIKNIQEKAKKRHSYHGAKIHRTWAKSLGLASRRNTRSLRYAPTDELLKTIVCTVVKDRMELQQFLDELYNRYGIIIGCAQAEKASYIKSNQGDIQAFKDNSNRLEMRLLSMGLIKRLSDACAYIENPMKY